MGEVEKYSNGFDKGGIHCNVHVLMGYCADIIPSNMEGMKVLQFGDGDGGF